jgi:hypothetical protein
MAIGTFQPLYDVGVTCMWGVLCHTSFVSPPRG